MRGDLHLKNSHLDFSDGGGNWRAGCRICWVESCERGETGGEVKMGEEGEECEEGDGGEGGEECEGVEGGEEDEGGKEGEGGEGGEEGEVGPGVVGRDVRVTSELLEIDGEEVRV